MKKKILFVCAVFLLCLGLFPVHRVHAASYVSGEPQGNATIAKVGKISVKVENKRLFARSGNEEWTYYLMDSKLSSNIVTNGSKVYYAINAKADGKSKIYSLSVKTGKKTLVKKVKADSISIQAYYGGKIFFNAFSPGSAAAYYYDIKENKFKKIQKDKVIIA